MKKFKKIVLSIFIFVLCMPSYVYAANKVGYNNAVNLTVRSSASTSASKVGILPIGSNVEILATATGNGCKTWYKFKYNGSDAYACGITTGGVEYIKTYTTTTLRTNARSASTDYEKQLEKAGFPSSYWDKLSALHAKYPNWNFVANKTGLDFNTAVNKETENVKTSLLYVGSDDLTYMSGYLSTASGSYNYKTNTYTALDSGRFYSANKNLVAYYMDPRNFLNESFLFYFEQLSYNSSYHTTSVVEKTLANSFLKAYKTNYYNAGRNNKVSPVHLATRSMLELGSSASFLTTGASFVYNANYYKNVASIYNKTFSKCYNFYNIGAYSDTKPAQNAAIYACGGSTLKETSYGRPWNTEDKAINGGALFLGNGYINKGQDTLYFQKFNTSSYTENQKYSHQYMQNIQAPSQEGSDTFDGYQKIGLINSSQSFTFIIPVYNNMPEKTNLPSSKNPNNYLSKIVVNASGKSYTVSNFDGDKTDNNYSVEVPSGTSSVTITATKVASTSSISVNDGKTITTSASQTKVPIKVTAANGSARTYYVTIKKQMTGVDSKVSQAGYTIANNYISKINPQETSNTFMNNIKKKDANASFVIKDKNNKAKTNTQALATGDKITIKSGSESKEYTVVIYGDVNGDGKITSLDYIRIKNVIMKTASLSSSAEKLAADVNKDGNIKATDYVRIKNHIMGTSKITQ